MSVIVTGGGGFIGSHLVENLLKKGEDVTVFDKVDISKLRNIKHLKGEISFVKGDVTSKTDVRDLFKNGTDIVYHLSAVVGVKNYIYDPISTIDVNITGTRNIAEEAMKKNVKILYTSTSEIFGKNPKIPWKESDDRVLGPTNIDRWTYSTSKSVCEHLLFALRKLHGTPMTIVRYFNVYGPGQDPIFVIPACVHRALNNKKMILYDRGTTTRCFTFIDDVIDATIKSAESEKSDGESFNLGSTTESNLNEVAKIIEDVSGSEAGVEYVDTKKIYGDSYEDIPRRIPDTTKAKNILDWQSTTPLHDGIEKTIKWCKKNKWWLDEKM